MTVIHRLRCPSARRDEEGEAAALKRKDETRLTFHLADRLINVRNPYYFISLFAFRGYNKHTAISIESLISFSQESYLIILLVFYFSPLSLSFQFLCAYHGFAIIWLDSESWVAQVYAFRKKRKHAV